MVPLWSGSLIMAQAPDSTSCCRPERTWTLATSAVILGGGSLVALDQAWYQGYDRTAFHFFDDSGEWLQVDKAGHAWTTYTLASYGHGAFRWAGCKESMSTWIGGTIGLAYLTGIEYLDGRSAEWGFSWSDMAANAFGTGLFIGQQVGWGEQRMGLKYSAHLTDFAERRPDLLGKGLAERILKDYNGSTVWLSVNLNALGCTHVPAWLNLATGYGGEGMLGAHEHPGGYRQVYLSPDLALTRIPTRSKVVRTVLFILDRVKVPLPTLEWREGKGFRGHWLYF
jgi:hypothetical protein